MIAPDPVATIASSPYAGEPTPDVSVGIATFQRAAFLPEVLGALEAQRMSRDRFEVIVVDDGSADATWQTLTDLARGTPLRLIAARIQPNHGPGIARNVAAGLARGRVIAFTDDDCIPTPGWLPSLADALEDDRVDIAQGRTLPAPAPDGAGPWDRSMWITRFTALFETCNIAYQRKAFLANEGFGAERRAVKGTRAHFGEDAELGWRVAGRDRALYVPGALVHHRIHAGTYREWLREKQRLSLFPSLVRRSPRLADVLWGRVFLSRGTAAFDAAILSLAGAATGRPWLLAGALPWLADRMREARRRPGRSAVVRLGQLAVGDAVALASLLAGSVRARRPVL